MNGKPYDICPIFAVRTNEPENIIHVMLEKNDLSNG